MLKMYEFGMLDFDTNLKALYDYGDVATAFAKICGIADWEFLIS